MESRASRPSWDRGRLARKEREARTASFQDAPVRKICPRSALLQTETPTTRYGRRISPYVPGFGTSALSSRVVPQVLKHPASA